MVIAGVVCLTLVGAVGVRRLTFDPDVLALLPQRGRVIPAFREYLSHFGTIDQLYIVFTAPDSHAIDEYRDDIEAWIDRLRAAPEIASVDTGLNNPSRDFGWLAGRQLLLLRGQTLEDALDRLSPEGLSREVGKSRELLALPGPEIAELVRQDPVGLVTLLRPVLAGTERQPGPEGQLGLDGYVTADGRVRIVIVRPRRPPYDTSFSRALEQRLGGIADDLQSAAERGTQGPDAEALDDAESQPPLQVAFAGGHQIAVETEALVRRESIVNTIGSLAVILPLLYAVFRSPWLVAVGALPAGLSLVIVLGALGFLGYRLSAAGTGASAMLFGLGIDGVVLLYVAHMLPESEVGPSVPVARLAGPAESMLLGMWTTAATFYGLAFVDFPSLQQLGLLVGHSMVICGVMTLLLVPALLPRRAPRVNARALTLHALPGWIRRYRRPILTSALLLTVILGGSAVRLRINPSLDRLRSVTPAATLETTVASAFGFPTSFAVILAQGPELDPLLETNTRLVERIAAALPKVGVQAPSALLPSTSTQARVADTIARSGLTAATVGRALERAAEEHGFRPGTFEPFAARLPALLDATERLDYEAFVQHGLGDLIARLVVRDGGQWHLVTYAFPSSDQEIDQLADIVHAVDPSLTLSGLPLVNRELSRTFPGEFLRGLAIGTALVVMLVLATFRDWRLSLLALIPTAIGLTWTAGILALAKVELDLFAAFAVVTLLGIGVDYGVHLVHRHLERGDATRATAELAPVILVAASITILGYGTLVASDYPPLRSIGVVSVVSVIALAVASTLVLPALLLAPAPQSTRS